MSAPDKCPKCGAEVMSQGADGYIRWRCWTYTGDGKTHHEAEFCLERQRDQLRGEVEQWKSYAERLEEAGDSCCIFGPESVLKDWQKAKETKP
jgi:hypothetical protein